VKRDAKFWAMALGGPAAIAVAAFAVGFSGGHGMIIVAVGAGLWTAFFAASSKGRSQ
jgi:hypothetical protein